MKSHKRNGKAAKAARKQAAQDRDVQRKQLFEYVTDLSPQERLLPAIFGDQETCDECFNNKLIGADCMTPHCKEIRNEESKFYDELTEDHITIRGATLEAGVDY